MVNNESIVNTIDKITLRLPIIPKFNTEEDRKHSRQVLEELGYENFDEFEYVIRG